MITTEGTEEARLETLLGFSILDTPPEPVFDDLARAAAMIAEAPMAMISFVDRDRLWFKARIGVPKSEVPRAGSFCEDSIRNPPLFVVPNAIGVERYRENPLVKAGVRFYAGVPLVVAQRYAVGNLSVLDVKPRRLTRTQQDALVVLAHAVSAQLELRREANSRLRRDRIMLSLLGDLKDGEQKLKEANATLERRVSERTAQIEGALKELEGFAYNIAHNLRAPLRSMNGYSQSLLRAHSAGLDAAGRDFLGRIAASSVSLDGMISDLLAYYELPCGVYPCEPVDLYWLLERVVIDMGKEVDEHQALVRVEPNLTRVIGNEILLRKVLESLLSNALKFTAPGVQPVVTFKIELRGPWVRLWVEDNGIGIAPQHQERIFQVFERLNRVESYPGNGIGLSIVGKATELMGGRSGVESSVGQGSRFWIELRLAEMARPDGR